ncbi:hypothetical protein VULLAG_LOCUS15633 [Vulpes lagopus]|uniref:translation initiation factor IF-2-like n=1 Tax=Vulpes lagopus TaxID=494514 RepID=UPI001BC9DB02|nr:translation initiation factor IF-2-like [Vulpes lagopus]
MRGVHARGSQHPPRAPGTAGRGPGRLRRRRARGAGSSRSPRAPRQLPGFTSRTGHVLGSTRPGPSHGAPPASFEDERVATGVREASGGGDRVRGAERPWGPPPPRKQGARRGRPPHAAPSPSPSPSPSPLHLQPAARSSPPPPLQQPGGPGTRARRVTHSGPRSGRRRRRPRTKLTLSAGRPPPTALL